MRRLLVVAVSGVAVTAFALWWMQSGSSHSDAASKAAAETAADATTPSPPETSPAALAALFAPTDTKRTFEDPLVIASCTLMPSLEQDVASQVDGTFQDVRVELGQSVGKGELLGRLDDRQLRAQVELLEIRAASTAAEKIARAQFDEAECKVQSALKAAGAVPALEYRTTVCQRDRYRHEIEKAHEEREAARKELEKATLVLGMHEIRSTLAGEVVKVHKRAGEAVKQAEPLFRIANCETLKVEGLCKVQQANRIRVGMRALVEPELRGTQMTELVGHTGSITAIAVSKDGRLIASASEDRNVLLWTWPQGIRAGVLPHPAEVTAVAIARASDADPAPLSYTLLTGCGDGQGRIWKISAQVEAPVPLPLSRSHEGAIRAVAFSPDGSLCATGGEDKRIGIWEVASGKHLYWLEADEGLPAHKGAVTGLHFAPDGYLVSAGRDNVSKLWKLGEHARPERVYPGRTGDVTDPGISPDGRSILFDMSEELRILERDSGSCLAVLRHQKQGRFQNFALFCPSGKLLLTQSSNSRLQLWRTPATAAETEFFGQAHVEFAAGDTPAPRLWQISGQQVRHFVIPSGSMVNCGVFAPDESAFFTGGTDKIVRVWAVPPARIWVQPLEARVTYVGSQVERGTDMVRIRAEMENPTDPERRLRAGLYAVMRLFPETAPRK